MPWDELSENKRFLDSEKGFPAKKYGDLSVALIYPGSYSAGMSSLGFQLIHRYLNLHNNIRCERAFSHPSGGCSLETGSGLSEFDVLSFSLSFEPQYFEVVKILESAKIPLLSKDRTDKDPLITAGGICVSMNPGPLSEIIDVFWIGDFENNGYAVYEEVLNSKGGKRRDILSALSGIEGCFVPSVDPDKKCAPRIADISALGSLCSCIVSSKAQFNMWLVEVSRGCGWNCRFCLVRWLCGSGRFRPKEHIIQDAVEGAKKGRKIGLLGPSVLDHPDIGEIMECLVKERACFSISSARADRLNPRILELLVKGGVKQITVAPETSDPETRARLNKNFGDDIFFEKLKECRQAGIESAKLYFMFGFPFGGGIDLLPDFVGKASGIINVSAGFAAFVPKPHTPLQWCGMRSRRELARIREEASGMLRKSKCNNFSFEDIRLSVIQGALSRSGKEASKFIKKGRISVQDAETLALREYGPDEKLPWDNIVTPYAEKLLSDEKEKALRPE
ncbi:MAG: radical SAM protein [bacterium]|nr:radical SAM protein [bacterium]